MAVDVAIIGGGIIGLSSAHLLADHGHSVTIYTKDAPENTTSMKAAAIWFPFKAAPLEKVAEWSKQSLAHYKGIANIPGSGVKWVELWVMDTPDQATAWLEAVPQDAYQTIAKEDLPAGYAHGYKVRVPMIDTSLFLPFLYNSFLDKGAIIYQTIESLDELTTAYDVVINCTGLAANQLTPDDKLFPIRGQIVKVEHEEGIRYMTDDHGPNALSYIIPRSDGIVLGGTAIYHSYDLQSDPQENRDILNRCKALEPALNGKVKESLVGLRPGRETVRLEREPDRNIIHNYGHGGSGFTTCWGCAMEVVNLVER